MLGVLPDFLDSPLFWQFIGGAVTASIGAGITSVVTLRTLKYSSEEQTKRELAAYERATMAQLATAAGEYYGKLFKLHYMAPGVRIWDAKSAAATLDDFSSTSLRVSALAGLCRDEQLRQFADALTTTGQQAILVASQAKAITPEGETKVKNVAGYRDEIYERIRQLSYGPYVKLTVD